jgi:hypothetical protein
MMSTGINEGVFTDVPVSAVHDKANSVDLRDGCFWQLADIPGPRLL